MTTAGAVDHGTETSAVEGGSIERDDGSAQDLQAQGRARDRCKHAWWGSFRGKPVSLAKWTNREITSKAEADKALDELTAAIRDVLSTSEASIRRPRSRR